MPMHGPLNFKFGMSKTVNAIKINENTFFFTVSPCISIRYI
jgi:hypothetical protein